MVMRARGWIEAEGRGCRLAVGSCLLACVLACPRHEATPTETANAPHGSESAPPKPASPRVPTLEALRGDGLVLRRTMCFGTCPAYQVALRAEGTVQWWGFHDVARVGPARASIPVDAATALVAEFDRLAVAQRLADEAAAAAASASRSRRISRSVSCTDVPSITLTLTRGGKSESLSEAQCSNTPTALAILAAAIDEAAQTQRWIAEDPCKPKVASAMPMVCLGSDADKSEVCGMVMPQILGAVRQDDARVVRLWAVDAAGAEARLEDARAGLVRLGVPAERVLLYVFPPDAEDPGGWDDGSVNAEVGPRECMEIEA